MTQFGLSDILDLYTKGQFPMAETRESDGFMIVEPDMRGIIPLDGLHISRSLKKAMARGDYHVTINHCFSRVMEYCAAPRVGHPETWISESLQMVYEHFHEAGFAHSLEIWDSPHCDADGLVGGLYGIALGGAFFGESMFSVKPNGSKIALVYLVERLNKNGFVLLDTQYLTDHLESMGGVEISQEDYLKILKPALQVKASFSA
ncbi:leucyl/phenylalanyl-tRNA--protein transferase [Fretibacter rubidus]|uniref:leucyl/phenylalanyl-tRNA--protein transferase n=1 Tax=Fretibacter rubidus TaxID=570162 RepID=UPI00352A37CC